MGLCVRVNWTFLSGQMGLSYVMENGSLCVGVNKILPYQFKLDFYVSG